MGWLGSAARACSGGEGSAGLGCGRLVVIRTLLQSRTPATAGKEITSAAPELNK